MHLADGLTAKKSLSADGEAARRSGGSGTARGAAGGEGGLRSGACVSATIRAADGFNVTHHGATGGATYGDPGRS